MEAQFPFPKFPILETERLRLRALCDKDVSAFFKIRSDADNMRYIPRPLAQSEDEILEFIKVTEEMYQKGEGLNFAIALKDSDEFIGTIGYYRIKWYAERTELGYILSPEHRGNGYVQEAVQEMIRWAFQELGFHSLEAIIDPRNTASINVVEKAGFIKEGHLKESDFWNGEYIDCLIYSLINS